MNIFVIYGVFISQLFAQDLYGITVGNVVMFVNSLIASSVQHREGRDPRATG